MILIIVESPTKARTLSRFLGGGYLVEATLGHIKDLPKSKLGVDIENNFKPYYEVVEKRQKEIKNCNFSFRLLLFWRGRETCPRRNNWFKTIGTQRHGVVRASASVAGPVAA